jgi:Ti-type conjugative transfer relaxase TraA
MAICYARLSHVNRSNGKNAVAKSAYYAKLKLEFEGTKFASPAYFDWSYKGRCENLLSHEIILPKGVDDAFKDPKYLWNSVEKFEKRKDSKVGIDFLLALPDDKVISNDERIEMAREFSKKYFVSKGYGVQINVHPPSRQKNYTDNPEESEKNERNYHAHILITPRQFREDGRTFSKKKVNDLGPEIRGNNHFAFNGIEWPKIWTQFQNEYFQNKGLDLRVDQSGLVSQIHLGPVRMRGKNSHLILDLHEKREELNRLESQDPNAILRKLTENKSLFVDADVELFLQKNISPDEVDNVRKSFWKNPQLVQLYDKDSQQALAKFTSREVIEEEQQILRLADRVHQKNRVVTQEITDSWNLKKEQLDAFEIVNGKPLSCIEGLAGTGKSYLLVSLKKHYEANGYRVRAFGPDNATVKVLKEKGFNDAISIHLFLYKNHFSKKKYISKGEEIWIIDEASKVANRPLLELLKSAEKNDIPLIFSGNSAQLSSVERGGMFKNFCDRYGHAFLGDVQRQKTQIDREISKRLAYGDVSLAVDMIAKSGGFTWCKDNNESMLKLVEKWAEDRLNFPYSTSVIIAHTNREVRQLNDLVHTVRMARGEISEKEYACQTIFGNIRVSEGDFIEFRANCDKIKVTNGQKGVLIKASEKKFVVATENRTVSFNPKEYPAFQLNYALTGFRSQGETIDFTYLLYNQQINQKLLYVGRTRHVHKSYCFVPKTEASCLMEIKRQVSRKSDVEQAIHYTTAEEIEKHQNQQQRESSLKEMCESESLLDRSKGYGFKVFDFVKERMGTFLEQIQDSRSDSSFYKAAKTRHAHGNVVEVKEEKLTLSLSQKQEEELENSKSSRSVAFQKLPKETKELYVKYFEKSEEATLLHTIVESEAAASSIPKESTPSFAVWQKACLERNQAAFYLSRSCLNKEQVLGQKGYDILQERVERYENSLEPKESIETKLKEKIESLLYELFPDGPSRRDSRGFRFGSNGSLAVHCVGDKKGCYYNHETKEGGNLLSLIEKKKGLNRTEAISWAKEFLNVSNQRPVPSHFSTAGFLKTKEETWISLIPPSVNLAAFSRGCGTPSAPCRDGGHIDLILPPSRHGAAGVSESPSKSSQIDRGGYAPPSAQIPKLRSLSCYLDEKYQLSGVYPYHNEKGEPIFYTLRLESKIDGRKIVLPLSYGKSFQEEESYWKLKAHSEKNKLLYNTHFLYQNPKKPVLIVEGEKTADAANKLVGKDYVVITWAGGAAAAKDANWKLLHGRNITIWPDNDPAGFKAEADISRELRKIGVTSLKVVTSEMLKDLPPKWDLADPLPAQKTSTFVSDCLLRAESKAIGMDRLSNLATQHGLTFNQVNDVVCGIDDRLRAELEKKHGPKIWEIEAAILQEANKVLSENRPPANSNPIISYGQANEKERNTKSIGLSLLE